MSACDGPHDHCNRHVPQVMHGRLMAFSVCTVCLFVCSSCRAGEGLILMEYADGYDAHKYITKGRSTDGHTCHSV